MVEPSDLSEEPQSEGLDIQRFIDLARRRHMHFLVPLFAAWICIWGASWVLPPRYRSTTLILVEEPSMPTNYVQPNVSENLQDRLQSITQQILSRTRLLSIIEKLHLYEGGVGQKTPDQKVELMRKDIDVQLVLSEQKKDITGFTVAYSAAVPSVAQQVTSELTDLFIDENLKSRQQASEDTTKFIENELENARTTLAEQEAKVREFQGKHEGELPSQQASNLQILSGLQAQLQNEQDALNNAKQQSVYFQALIGQYRSASVSTGTVEGQPTTLPAINQELDALRSKLADLSSHYNDRYPDIQNLKREIAKTEKLRDGLVAGLKEKDKDRDGSNVAQESAGSRAGDRSGDSVIMQLDSQLHANKMELGNREKAIADLKERINAYQARLNDEPAIEQELADLTRGYEQSKANFDELLKKKNDSTMATSMEQMQQGERFRMLDPPSLPSSPDFPDRLKLCGMGVAVGIVLGLIVVGGFEVRDDRIYREQKIKDILPIAILSEIPQIVIPSDERARKRRAFLGWATAVLVFAFIAGGSAFTIAHDGLSGHSRPAGQGQKN
jgi:succinoglycan biosynthesis transport protein ExoP